MIDACAIPTAWVFVIAIGPVMVPDSSIHDTPVISPLPFWEWTPAAHGSPGFVRPRGWFAVTPVRTSSPSISVAYPTSTSGTSVTALLAPTMPAKGIPRARARGFPPGVSRSGVCAVMPWLRSPGGSGPGLSIQVRNDRLEQAPRGFRAEVASGGPIGWIGSGTSDNDERERIPCLDLDPAASSRIPAEVARARRRDRCRCGSGRDRVHRRPPLGDRAVPGPRGRVHDSGPGGRGGDRRFGLTPREAVDPAADRRARRAHLRDPGVRTGTGG